MIVIPELHIGRGTTRGSVTVFPVWWASPPLRRLVTGGAATLDVSEMDDGAEVSHVAIANCGKSPALILEGELLEGGLQSRALVRDVILQPESRRLVEVACVEQGRWGGTTEHQRHSRRATPRVVRSLRTLGPWRQDRVWQDVDRYQSLATSPTLSLADQLEMIDGRHADTEPAMVTLPGQCGVLVGVGGQPLGLELFGTAAGLATHLPAILDGARMDGMLIPDGGTPVPSRRARRFAGRLQGVELSAAVLEDAGMGLSLIAETEHAMVRGVALMDGRIAHLSVLNTRHPVLEMA